MLTAEQLEERRKGITATDAAKIVGQSPYGCAEDVRLDKMGAGRPFIEHDRVKWGNILEDPIRKDYAERHGVTVVGGDEIGTLRHPTEPWALATPDGLIYLAGPNAGIPAWGHEIKTHTSWLSHLYGEPGTDEVPAWELIQCAINIWVVSAHFGVQIERWDLTVFLDGLPTDYTIMRDPDLEAALISACRGFWEIHVVNGEPCGADGSEHYSEILKAKWPKHLEESLEATLDHRKLINELHDARATRKGWMAEEERLVQEIKLIMGEAATLEWLETIGGKEKTQKINWKRSKDSQRVDWKAVAKGYRDNLERLYHHENGRLEGLVDDLDGIEDEHTTTKPGSRSFTVPRSWSSK